MELETLRKDMIAAMKAGDKARKESISSLVSAVKKAGIDAGCRENIPTEIVDKAIMKELKTAKEQIDTCPADRTELIEKYTANYNVIAEYAPKMMSEQEIREYITSNCAEALATKNKGMIMKTVMAGLKGKADGKLINSIVAELTK